MAMHRPASETSDLPEDERLRFSERLKSALHQQKKSLRPSSLVRAFNLRAPEASVSAHAARKWLVGEAIPAQERLVVLARWLNVDPSWLRFGHGKSGHFLSVATGSSNVSSGDLALLSSIVTLSVPSQQVVQGLVRSLRELEDALSEAGSAAAAKASAAA